MGCVGWVRASALAVVWCLLAAPSMASAQAGTVVKPWFMVIFDNSGSMDASTGSGNNTCGQERNRISDAKCVLQRVVDGYGDVTFGLERFTESCSGSCSATCTDNCGCSCTYLSCSGCNDSGSGCPSGGSNAAQGQVLVPLQEDNQSDILQWINYSCGTCSLTSSANPELEADTWTPLAGSLRAARQYFQGRDPRFGTSPIDGDAFRGCRPYSVILLTDGEETCASDAQTLAAATELRSTSYGGATYDIRTYIIIFGQSPPHTPSENIAIAGGTDAPGPRRAFYASDEESLALAFSQIISDSILFETCNNEDDDCDGLVDEGFQKYCDVPRGILTRTLCADPGDPCNDTDDNCFMGQLDETRNACGTCGPAPAEVCDAADNDCDGRIDEGDVCMGCRPVPEICDNMDQDCDGRIDEGLTRPCGTDVGECSRGVETCTAGVWGGCTAVGPTPETCDNEDDDCDGVIDGITRPCGTSDVGICQFGTEICIAGRYTDCTGAIDPDPVELCDGEDDDCDGEVDEDTGGGICGSDLGPCEPGRLSCVGGRLVCTGGVGPSPELCNGDDDDCDGFIDEGNPEGGGACGDSDVGTCELGREVCVDAELVCMGELGPSDEICDGLDNDCDGEIDEGDPESGMACGDDTGECSPGVTSCVDGELECVGGVGPVDEICDGLDNDCDGVEDEGIGVGAPCGTDVGECSPGINICRDGERVCEGEIAPIDELCDFLDNDCDGTIDEGLPVGEPCGSMEGTCEPGAFECIDGREICVGEVPAAPEVCDCEDNDCDGEIDEEDAGALCPEGTACVGCGCALPCTVTEFGVRCPEGRSPEDVDGTCYCVAPRCSDELCAAETITAGGETRCAPDDPAVERCVCKNNECTFACEGVTCPDGLVCDPRDVSGRCVEDSCRGLGCLPGELCDVVTGECGEHPCAGVSCSAGQACRDGACEDSCATITCGSGEVCHGGRCEDDRCDGAVCDGGRICNPADGSCIDDMCEGVRCPTRSVCDPMTGDCESSPCDLLVCPDDQICIDGECALDTGGGVDGGVDAGDGTTAPGTRVLATGRGGCTCRATTSGDGGGGAALLSLIVIGLLVRRRLA